MVYVANHQSFTNN